MKRSINHFAMRFFRTALVGFVFLSPCGLWAEGTLKVGAFNIQIFGESKVAKPHVLEVLAKIATNYDLLAVEEVGSNGSTATDQTCIDVMDRYVSAINKSDGSTDFSYVRGNQYALVYRTSKLKASSPSVYSGTQHLTYAPLTAFFNALDGNLDFSVVVIHTSPKSARVEIPALKIVMSEVAQANKDPDVICMGDFNADGAYYSEGSDPYLAGYPQDQYVSAIKNTEDTTVAKSSNTYDRIELSRTLKEDFEGESGVLEYTENLDVSQVEGTAKNAGTASAVSDHWPVWAVLWTDRDTD